MSSTEEEIIEVLNDFDRSSKALKKHIFKLCWYMRGSINLDEMYQLGFNEREMLNDIIEENIETTNKTGLPFF